MKNTSTTPTFLPFTFALALGLCASVASAEGQASLYYGRAGIDIVPVLSVDTFGGSVGFFAGAVGAELAVEHMPVGGLDLGIASLGASMTNLMGNFVVQVPIGRVQPYGTLGYGALYGRAGLDPFLTIGGVTGALNFGGGAKVFVTERVGVRFDYRRFVPRTDGIPDVDLPLTDLTLSLDPNLDRFIGGVTFRF